MSLTIDTREDVAKEIYFNGFYAQDWQEQFPTWQEFMNSPEFEEECDRLRSKFD
jgi:serine protease inhibitor